MKHVFHLLAIAMLILGFTKFTNGQFYSFSQTNQPYMDLTNPTIVTTDFSSSTYTVTLGEDFAAYGKTFSADGSHGMNVAVDFGAVTFYNSTYDSIFSIDGFLAQGLLKRSSKSSVSYSLESVGTQKVVKVQWKDVTLQGGNPNIDSVNFQIWFFQGGDVEVHIGNIGIGSPPGNVFFGGVSGPSIGLFLAHPSFSLIHNTMFLTGAPSNAMVNTTTLFANLNGIPQKDQVFIFNYQNSTGISHHNGSTDRFEFHLNIKAGKLILLNHASELKGVKLQVYDILGRRLNEIRIGTLETGANVLTLDSHWDLRPNGIYVVRLSMEDEIFASSVITSW